MLPRAPVAAVATLALVIATVVAAGAASAGSMRYDKSGDGSVGGSQVSASASCHASTDVQRTLAGAPSRPPCSAHARPSAGDDPGSDPGDTSANVENTGSMEGTQCVEGECAEVAQEDGAGAAAGTDRDGDGAPDGFVLGAGIAAEAADHVGSGAVDAHGGCRGGEGGHGADGGQALVASCSSGGEAGGDDAPASLNWATESADAGNHSASVAEPGDGSAGAGGAHHASVQVAEGEDPCRACGTADAEGGVGASSTDTDGDGVPDEVEVEDRANANGRKTVKARDV